MNFVNDLLLPWLGLFAAPLKNFDMLWVIIPIYLGWILTEIYQEKKGTSLGNAISNGVIVLWVGIDWARQTVNAYLGKTLEIGFFTKLSLAVMLFLYGFWVVKIGIETKKSTHIFGRIRMVTYVLLMFTPLFYGTTPLTWSILLAILIFAPVFYIIIEIIDRLTPNPKVYQEDDAFASGEKGMKDFGKDTGSKDNKLGSDLGIGTGGSTADFNTSGNLGGAGLGGGMGNQDLSMGSNTGMQMNNPFDTMGKDNTMGNDFGMSGKKKKI